MKKIFILATCAVLLFACSDEKKDEPKTGDGATADADKKNQPAEFADPKYAEWGKKMSAQFASGNIEDWITNYADDAKFRWSSGDSLSGKAEISKYWGDRRKNAIDSISFTNEIFTPLKVNIPQTQYDVPGVWLLHWYMVNVKYKNGKRLMFWVHTDHHYNANDKIDVTIQYIDRAPINAALGAK